MNKDYIFNTENQSQGIAVDFDKFLDTLGPEYEEGCFSKFELQTFSEELTEAEKALDECFDENPGFTMEDFEGLGSDMYALAQEKSSKWMEEIARAGQEKISKWGMELAEGTFMNTTSIEQTKQFLAATTDNYRRVYEKFETELNTEKPQNTIKISLKINEDEKVYEVSLPEGLCVSSKRIFEQVDESFARIMKDLTPTNTLQVASLIPLKRYLYDCYNKYWEQLEKERYYHDLACEELANETMEDIEKFFEEYGVKLQ